MNEVVIGLDIGTSSTKAVAVDRTGRIVAMERSDHTIEMPRPGWVEQDAESVWWRQPCSLLTKLTGRLGRRTVSAIAVSGLGPCVLPCDSGLRPLRPAILYGIDTRSTQEITEIEAMLGAEEILARSGSALSSQAAGPKLAWLRRHEPAVWRQTAGWYTASSFVIGRLTGEYVLDHHTASQCDPLYDLHRRDWARDWAEAICPEIPLPRLVWSDQVIGQVSEAAAAATGIRRGTPVLGGTVDAWAEAHSVGVRQPGDLMLMYGSTMFMVGVFDGAQSHPALWHTAGLSQGVSTLAAGMATSGLVASWLADITSRSVADLGAAAADVPPGSEGLLLLPYFAGERSPLFDPGARGVLLGLTLSHTPAHLMRAVYEAVAMGVRHILEAFTAASTEQPAGPPRRLVAVGGGASAQLWVQIVSDACGEPQLVPRQTIGACYGDALLAAAAAGLIDPSTDWTETSRVVEPHASLKPAYDKLYGVYRDLYPATRPLIKRLVKEAVPG